MPPDFLPVGQEREGAEELGVGAQGAHFRFSEEDEDIHNLYNIYNIHIHKYIHTHTHTYIYIYIYMYVCGTLKSSLLLLYYSRA